MAIAVTGINDRRRKPARAGERLAVAPEILRSLIYVDSQYISNGAFVAVSGLIENFHGASG